MYQKNFNISRDWGFWEVMCLLIIWGRGETVFQLMKARALFSAGLLCAKQGEPAVQWQGRTGGTQVAAAAACGIPRGSVGCDVPSCVLSVLSCVQFCLWDLSDGTGSPTHQTLVPEESPFQKWHLPALLVCPWHCLRPGAWAEAVPCSAGISWQCLSAIPGSSTFLLIRKNNGGGAVLV